MQVVSHHYHQQQVKNPRARNPVGPHNYLPDLRHPHCFFDWRYRIYDTTLLQQPEGHYHRT
jgi:hypothetical protein